MFRKAGLLVFAAAAFVLPAAANTYTVTTTADSGAGSLRQAILDANAHAGLDTIAFAVGSGPITIQPASAFPAITDPVVLDGRTQPGFAGKPIVEIDNHNIAPYTTPFLVSGGGSTIRGLILNHYAYVGIRLEGGGNNVVAGNYLGVNAAGNAVVAGALPPSAAVVVASANNTIGGSTAADRNVIAGHYAGVSVGSSATGTIISGNYIGPDATGTAKLGNGAGISVDASGGSITIGGATAAERNVISGNNNGISAYGVLGTMTIRNNYIGVDATGNVAMSNGYGAAIYPPWDNSSPGPVSVIGNVISANTADGIDLEVAGCTVKGNKVGVGADGSTPLGNGWFGVLLLASPGVSTNDVVGGTAPGDANIIANNVRRGVAVLGRIYNNRVSGNSIYNNGIGIETSDLNSPPPHDWDPLDADEGANHVQNVPELTGVSAAGGSTTFDGFLETGGAGTYALEFFASPACSPTGFGEGKRFLGAATLNATHAGHNTFHVSLAVDTAGQTITATATDSAGNSSEFSRCYTAGGFVLFSSPTYNTAEGTGAVVLTVLRRGALPAVTVDYATVDGTALAGSDYTAMAGTLSFAANETSKTISIPILDDAVVDPGESFSVVLKNATGDANILAPSTATVFIADNDAAGGGTPNILVTNTNDSGAGSLRQAILDANVHPGRDVIGFAIGSGVQTIHVNSALPEITDPVVIDGTTQPGFSGHPIIELYGGATTTTAVNGFVLTAGGSTIRGLAIHHFTLALVVQTKGGNVIAGNYFGLTPAGDSSVPDFDPGMAGTLYPFINATALYLVNGTTGNRIGGPAAADRNVFSAHQMGVFVDADHCDGTVIEGNYFGTKADGTGRVRIGIAVNTYSSSIVRKNVIGNAGQAIASGGDGTIIQGNIVGFDVTGRTVQPIDYWGISIYRGDSVLVGGPAAADRNVVGPTIRAVLVNASNTRVEGNYIGTDISGNVKPASPNGGVGLSVRPDIDMGGVAKDDVVVGNVIAGDTYGLWLNGSTRTTVLDNKIGVGADGTTPLGSTTGTALWYSGDALTIGTPGHGNVVANFFQGLNGSGASVRANSSYANVFGSSLASSVTSVAWIGAVGWAEAGDGRTSVGFSLSGPPSRTAIVDFYANPTCVQDGKLWLGSASITTDVRGLGGAVVILPVASGSLTYTVTDVTTSQTQGFFPCTPIVQSGAVDLAATSYRVAENAGHVTVDLIRRGGSDGTLVIGCRTADGTAKAGSDYGKVLFEVEFKPGEIAKQVDVPIIDDAVNEPTESFTFNIDGHSVGTVTTATITIDDDDLPLISVGDVQAAEGNSGTTAFNVPLKLSNPSSQPVSVKWRTADGSAKEGEDYVAAAGTLEFAPGETRKIITIQVVGDTVPEPDEIFGIAFSQPVNGLLERQRSIVRILNDDPYYRTLNDVEYGRADGQPLRADLYLPTDAARPTPAVIWLHDGDWTNGLRTPSPAEHEAGRGYAVVAIDYRLAPGAHFPAPVADVKMAIRWLRANAAQYNVDPTRIALWGSGGGGYLAALAGLASEVDAFDNTVDANLGQSARVSAVVDWGGAANLVTLAAANGCDGKPRDAVHAPEAQLLGCAIAACPSTAAGASPVNYATPDDPPFLIMHALANCAVPATQSRELAAALVAKDVPVTLIEFGNEANGAGFWESADVLARVDEFLDKSLGVARRRVTAH